MVNRIYISEAMKQVGYKDNRSFRRWCDNNNIGILSNSGSNKRYVIHEEFEAAKTKESLRYLRNKYGGLTGEYIPSPITSIKKQTQAIQIKYTPKGEHAKSLIAILTPKNSEL